MSVKQEIIYDEKRDGKLEYGDTIYIYEDGSRKTVKGKNERKR